MDDDAATLRLFHLLDPAAYRLDDEEAFAARIQGGRKSGGSSFVIASDSSGFVMSRAVEIGRKVLMDDLDAQRLLDSLNAAVEADDENAIGEERARLREY